MIWAHSPRRWASPSFASQANSRASSPGCGCVPASRKHARSKRRSRERRSSVRTWIHAAQCGQAAAYAASNGERRYLRPYRVTSRPCRRFVWTRHRARCPVVTVLSLRKSSCTIVVRLGM
eukprot:scaffold7044_cov216-Pinguiococcus_pyrenoidosus.AAC.1